MRQRDVERRGVGRVVDQPRVAGGEELLVLKRAGVSVLPREEAHVRAEHRGLFGALKPRLPLTTTREMSPPIWKSSANSSSTGGP